MTTGRNNRHTPSAATSGAGTNPSRGFTLIEVMVSVGVLALLVAILAPSLSHAREAGRRTVCANNLRQWAITCHYYRDDNDDYLPTEGFHGERGLNRPGTWYNELPPYIEAPAYKDIEGAGRDIAEIKELNVWICPSKNRTRLARSGSGKNQFHYGMNQVLVRDEPGAGRAGRSSRRIG